VKINALSFRLLLSAGLVLAAFFVLAIWVLERGFRESAEESLKEKLQLQIYSLLAVTEMSHSGRLKIPLVLQESRFSEPGSGLLAVIRREDKKIVWRSYSTLGAREIDFLEVPPGTALLVPDKYNRFVLHYAVIWENEKTGLSRKYIFSVAEDNDFIAQQVQHFRRTLRSWFMSVGLVLIMIQFVVLRWSLIPLRRIVTDLTAIEAGEKSSLDGRYPSELVGLANNLNALISSERAHLERYRNTLADLSHSLKTPLAILRGCMEREEIPRQIVQDQISRMNEIIEYQLQRAAAKGRKKLTGKINAAEIVKKIITSLEKVYRDKQIVFSLDIDESLQVYCEEGDLYEIAGNLLDNAGKWCQKNIKVSLLSISENRADNCKVLLQIEDDGGGIAPEKLTEILKRGVRADEKIQGHGIGMAVVHDLVELLDGKLTGERSSALGGMKWKVYLP
jgi:two-component system sensor histidine kinase PhoQ